MGDSAPPPFGPDQLATVELRQEDGVSVATVEGEIDISNVRVVAEALTSLPNQALGLVLDLRTTSYLDSAAVSMLHDLTTRLTQRSQGLALVCDERSLPRRVLKLTGVDTRTEILADVAEAVAHVRRFADSGP